jgi:transglutaminase-like putative cysteine protease
MPRYRIEHETCYDYGAPVSESWQMARLTPRTLKGQRLLWHRLLVDPGPDEVETREDSFGNLVTRFALHRPHVALRVHMHCEVELDRPSVVGPQGAPAWETVREALRPPARPPKLLSAQACEASSLLPWSLAARDYASLSFWPGRNWFEAVHELMERIHGDFRFDTGVTTVSTPVDTVLERRAGVCQDFAHLMIAGLRAMGLPALYMSGYLLTQPPPGLPRLAGVDASHAWVAAWAPDLGWVGFDPTNNTLADERYVVLGWGGDYADVVPLRGVILGGGEQRLNVKVSVWPEAER